MTLTITQFAILAPCVAVAPLIITLAGLYLLNRDKFYQIVFEGE